MSSAKSIPQASIPLSRYPSLIVSLVSKKKLRVAAVRKTAVRPRITDLWVGPVITQPFLYIKLLTRSNQPVLT